jgi:mannose/cellobiose epimerase-like protein (N-acyl-D-glucosamine 2-epimerase family)
VPVLDAETEELLAFARAARVPGGFAWLDAAGRPDPGRGLHLWITARMTHVFALSALLGDADAALVDHGLEALATSFADPLHGGWWGELRDGAPVSTRKAAYEHAFVLLAASSARIAGRPGAGALWDTAAATVAGRFWREDEGAFAESFARDWSAPEAYRGANANMHMVEACLAAGDASGDPAWAARALATARRLVDGVARAHDWRVVEHFDPAWTPLPDYNDDRPRDPFRPFGVTPGHGLEWARLLVHLRGRPPRSARVAARGRAAACSRAPCGTAGRSRRAASSTPRTSTAPPVVRDRFHWAVAEAVAAAAVLHAATGEEGDATWHRRLLAFAREHLADPERGSWHHELDATCDLQPGRGRASRDVYHVFQALLLDRLPLAPSLAGAARSLSADERLDGRAQVASSAAAWRRAPGTSPPASTTTSR